MAKRKTTPTKSNRRKSKKKLIRKRKALKPINFKRELAAGIKVELEHTKHIRSKAKARKVAERIARDHLRETPSYYQKLKKCFPHEHHNNPGRPGKSCMIAPFRVPKRNPVAKEDMEAMNRLAAKMNQAAKRAGRTNTDTADLTPSERTQYRRLRGKFGAALALEFPRYHEGMGGSPSYNPKTMKNYIVKEMMPDWKRRIDPRSIRTKTIWTKKGGKRLLRIGCPKGEWLTRQKRCKSSTKAISMLTPKSEKILSLHGKAAAHRAAGNPDKKFWRDLSVRSTELLHGCHQSYTGRGAKRQTQDTYKQYRERTGRIASEVRDLAVHEELLEQDPRFKHLTRSNPSGKLTIKQAKLQMPSGFVLSKDQAGEYVVRQRGSPAGEGYFTNDLRDAVDTAKDMSIRAASHAESQSRSRIVPRRTNPHDERSRMAIPGRKHG